jgi:SPX domain protein involved in polyphosphate accumulation
MSEASYDEKFKDLEEEVATLVADVHDLALYTKLNFTGFVKIVKARIRCERCRVDKRVGK